MYRELRVNLSIAGLAAFFLRCETSDNELMHVKDKKMFASRRYDIMKFRHNTTIISNVKVDRVLALKTLSDLVRLSQQLSCAQLYRIPKCFIYNNYLIHELDFLLSVIGDIGSVIYSFFLKS